MIGSNASKAISLIVAKAIRHSRKFGANEHEACMKGFAALRKEHPEYGDEIDERIVTLGNRSAFSKDLAKAGLVSEGEASAFAREIGEAIDAVAEAEKAELAKMTAKKP